MAMRLPQSHRSSSISVNQAATKDPSSYTDSCFHGQSRESGNVFPQMRSQSIPISSSHFHRTASEIQLCLDEQIAEQRDILFYSRVVTGIRQTQLSGKDHNLMMQNQLCLTHISQVRRDASQKQAARNFLEIFNSPVQESAEEDDWGVGIPIDAAMCYPSSSSSQYQQQPFMLTRRDVHSIAADAIELANLAEEQGMIFDLDL